MFIAISPIISFVFALSELIALKVFIKYKNLMLVRIPDLVTSSHITTNNAQTIWIHKQTFISLSNV